MPTEPQHLVVWAALALGVGVLVAAGCSRGSAPPAEDGAPGEVATPHGESPATGSAAVPAPPAPLPSPSMAPDLDTESTRRLRAGLVAELRRDGNVTDERVLAVIGAIPRHAFAPWISEVAAYRDEPQPIGDGQTISQPTVVGVMTQALELTGRETVLEIGTGSGYQAAVLAKLAKQVFTIELLASLGDPARERLARLGHANVEVRVGDGYAGWPEHAPFDRIVITAAPPEMPQALVDQLAEGGVLVAPVGAEHGVQRLLRLRKKGGGIEREDLGAVRFVPMVKGR